MEPAKENIETAVNPPIEELLIDGPLSGTDTSYKWVEENTDLQKINNGFPIHMIEEVIKIRDFDVEFRVLKRITETTKHSDQLLEYHPSHLHMNRYKNVIPFKSTLVTLPKDICSTEESQYFDTYINANYVSSCFKNSDKFFIATQGPLDGTRKNFWKMVWTENASSILMLCKPIENATGNIQCNIYWPRETTKPLELDGFKITLEKEVENLPGLVRRDFILECTDPETKVTSSRKVRQYQCQKWPDNGVPPKEDYNQVDELIKIMDEEKGAAPEKPIVIHCSAGIGRSGTLIAIYNLLRTINYYRTIYTRDDDEETKASYKISVFGTVRRIREQRWGSVQTNEQYTFIYEFVKDYCIRIGFV